MDVLYVEVTIRAHTWIKRAQCESMPHACDFKQNGVCTLDLLHRQQGILVQLDCIKIISLEYEQTSGWIIEYELTDRSIYVDLWIWIWIIKIFKCTIIMMGDVEPLNTTIVFEELRHVVLTGPVCYKTQLIGYLWNTDSNQIVKVLNNLWLTDVYIPT